jgi:hypothetical protein
MYYRRFVPGFSTKASPLFKLYHKDQTFHWGKEQNDAFKYLKEQLCKAPILARYNPSPSAPPLVLFTDACKEGLGAVLTQKDADGNERVILYASRGTRKAEKNYGVTKLECLAVIWAVTKLRYYLIGRRFHIVSDHSALQWLLDTKDPTGQLARWVVILQEYDYEMKYRPGRVHQNADALSRIPHIRIPPIIENTWNAIQRAGHYRQ